MTSTRGQLSSELSFRGMDRGMFEMFIVVFLVVGIWQSAEFTAAH